MNAGIVGYGPYIPKYRLDLSCISRHWGYDSAKKCPPLPLKSFVGRDEDTITMSIETVINALKHSGISPKSIGGFWLGTESKPYAVKPSTTVVAEAVGIGPYFTSADLEFACKAGTEALTIALSSVASKRMSYALAVGVDSAQAKRGDELEMTAAAGGCAFIIGPVEESIALVEKTVSITTDTPDFFRRDGMKFPTHGRRFSGAPAYFENVVSAGNKLLELTGKRATDYDHAVFHYPTPSFPRKAGQRLGFIEKQLEMGLIGDLIGNTYAGSTMLGLAAVLDVAHPGERIFCVSYGSGAGSDAVSLLVTDTIVTKRKNATTVRSLLNNTIIIRDYAQFLHMVGCLNEE